MLVSKDGYHDHEQEGLEITESMHVDVELDIITGTDIPANHAVQVYPNPARELVNIKSEESIRKIVVLDMFGREVHVAFPNSEQATLPVTHLSPGVFYLKIYYTQERPHTIKLQVY